MYPVARRIQRVLIGGGDRVEHLEEHGQVVRLAAVTPDEQIEEEDEVALDVLHARLVVLELVRATVENKQKEAKRSKNTKNTRELCREEGDDVKRRRFG